MFPDDGVPALLRPSVSHRVMQVVVPRVTERADRVRRRKAAAIANAEGTSMAITSAGRTARASRRQAAPADDARKLPRRRVRSAAVARPSRQATGATRYSWQNYTKFPRGASEIRKWGRRGTLL